MRAYLGAAVLQQENVLRIPHVYVEGRCTNPDRTWGDLWEAYLKGNLIFRKILTPKTIKS